MIEWSFNREKSLVEVRLSGIITAEEIENYIKDLAQIKDLPDQLFVLRDMSDSNISALYKSRGAVKVLNDLKVSITKYKQIKEAILQTSPVEAAISYLYVRFFSGTKNYQIKIFSTRSAAMKWLGM